MMLAALAIGFVFIFWMNMLNGDQFNEDMALERALRRVLEATPYKDRCGREHFRIDLLVGHFDSPTYEFNFTPKTGHEDQCPAVPVSVDRDTGEVWLLRM